MLLLLLSESREAKNKYHIDYDREKERREMDENAQ